MRRLPFAITVGLLASACSTNTGVEPALPDVGPPALIEHEPLGNDEVLSRFSALPARKLADGTCGLFLWLRRDDAPLLFFQRSDTGTADMIFDGSERTLERTSAERQIAFNFFEAQTFFGPNYSVSVKVQAEDERSIRQGIKIESGTLSITLQDGWSAALPVGGVIG